MPTGPAQAAKLGNFDRSEDIWAILVILVVLVIQVSLRWFVGTPKERMAPKWTRTSSKTTRPNPQGHWGLAWVHPAAFVWRLFWWF